MRIAPTTGTRSGWSLGPWSTQLRTYGTVTTRFVQLTMMLPIGLSAVLIK